MLAPAILTSQEIQFLTSIHFRKEKNAITS